MKRIQDLESLRSEAAKIWDPIKRKILDFLTLPIAPLPPPPPTLEKLNNKWRGYIEGEWIEVEVDQLPLILVFDAEAATGQRQDGSDDEKYTPTVAAIWGSDGNWYYWETPSPGHALTIPIPTRRIILGQDHIRSDKRYFSCEYDRVDSQNYYLDLLALGMIVGGLSSSDTSTTHSKWKKFDAIAKQGKPVPQWYQECGPLNLKFLSKRFLGLDLDKTVRDRILKDPLAIQPETLFEYNCGDVEATFRLIAKLFPMALGFANHPCTWLGMGSIARSKYYLKDWEKFKETSEQSYSKALGALRKVQTKVVNQALDVFKFQPSQLQMKYPGDRLDWTPLTRGANKGFPRFYTQFQKSTFPFKSDFAVVALQLTWNDTPIELRAGGRGDPKWWVGDEPLPHPEGPGAIAQVGSPFTKDFAAFADSGILKSLVLTQEQLKRVFSILTRLTQWNAYRKRYSEIYSIISDAENLEICCSELNPTGTISRRSTSRIWEVLPKPTENVIGSEVMRHLVAPPGYTIFSADFPNQESRIAVGPLTDARFEKHCSSPWSEAVLTGDKSKGTDTHSTTARFFNIVRPGGKKINFTIQYQGGVKKVAGTLSLIKGIPFTASQLEAAEFIKYLKGPEGVARNMFDSLSHLANVKGLTSYLLSVKQPNTINPRLIPDGSMFFTLRANWPIQTSGVDEKHVLIFLIKRYLKQLGLSAIFGFEIHDNIVYYGHKHQELGILEVFDMALEDLMVLSYKAAAIFWDRYDPKPAPRVALDPLTHWCKFEEIDVQEALIK